MECLQGGEVHGAVCLQVRWVLAYSLHANICHRMMKHSSQQVSGAETPIAAATAASFPAAEANTSNVTLAPCAGHILDLPPPPAPSPRSNGGGDADATDTHRPPTAAPSGDKEATGKLPVLSAGDWMRRGMLAERLRAGLGDGAKGQAALAYSCCCRCVESCAKEWTRGRRRTRVWLGAGLGDGAKGQTALAYSCSLGDRRGWGKGLAWAMRIRGRRH